MSDVFLAKTLYRNTLPTILTRKFSLKFSSFWTTSNRKKSFVIRPTCFQRRRPIYWKNKTVVGMLRRRCFEFGIFLRSRPTITTILYNNIKYNIIVVSPLWYLTVYRSKFWVHAAISNKYLCLIESNLRFVCSYSLQY